MRILKEILDAIIYEIKSFLCKKPSAPKEWNRLEDHERRGETICPNCNKKFMARFSELTMDVVYILDKPERITTTQGYCPHCHHSFGIGYTLRDKL